ncbi:hypothetical protein [Mesorhizobium sp. M2A.F.Ca.ET.043.02.1.1]|uniref:hypothetical protein n=1 Tax=Mesorhizobium sp. M2A.F.Ca.ET.043.02.1.1 TaxID=2493670 RepID=UPI000F75A58A|nr:hypothetical protein [Mesorhizobium sp. M2A.F.Ca.ET.043.02.1.1]AZO05025.1 hypothetical protein EJ068_19505 [Mesorhizobium sp. M2A.F.Ca.ET.043.02.1.1]
MHNPTTLSGAFRPFEKGDALLESSRAGPIYVLTNHQNGQATDATTGTPLDWFLPKKDDYKALRKGLSFLKFKGDDLETMFNMIGTAANIAAGIVTVVGWFNTATDLLKKIGILDSKNGDPTAEAVQQIKQQTDAIYKHLEADAAIRLHTQADQWLSLAEGVHTAVGALQTSRSPAALASLDRQVGDLNNAIREMLKPSAWTIAFARDNYGYKAHSWHWIDASGSPCLVRADGTASQVLTDLGSTIFDVGYFHTVLMRCLHARLEAATALEPAFRSTNYGRGEFAEFAAGLDAMIQKWRESLYVAKPEAGFGAGGKLINPLDGDAPDGVMIGAADPVSGISAIQNFVTFDKSYHTTHYPGVASGDVPDSSKAVNPEDALAKALAAHTPLVDQVIAACGLNMLRQLQQKLAATVLSPRGSDFAHLSDVLYTYVAPEGPIIAEPITLGRLARYAPDPDKVYRAVRAFKTGVKQFHFGMARRSEMANVQLGYALFVNGTRIDLCDFSAAPPLGETVEWFPKTHLDQTLDIACKVYDCIQDRATDEDAETAFEAGDTILRTRRMLLNERDGEARIRVKVSFDPAPDGGNADHYVGRANVEVYNLDPEQFRDAASLDLMVWETHVSDNAGADTVEVIADTMSLHIIPSTLTVEKVFFDDLLNARGNMIQHSSAITTKFNEVDQTPPDHVDIDPKKVLEKFAHEIEKELAFIDRFDAGGSLLKVNAPEFETPG